MDSHSCRVSCGIVNAHDMRAIEEQHFRAGLPVAALMEKAGLALAARVRALYPKSTHPTVGVVAGRGHNGGDALVVARELLLEGRHVHIFAPGEKRKELTAQHLHYALALGAHQVATVRDLADAHVIVDGLLGVGLASPARADATDVIRAMNALGKPIVSLDVPSGLNADNGHQVGTAVRATHTLTLGFWKEGLLDDAALPYVGVLERLDLGIGHPVADGKALRSTALCAFSALASLPLKRSVTAHKYTLGPCLLIVGSDAYPGAALLAVQGCRASGVGYMRLAVPLAHRSFLLAQVPDAVPVSRDPDSLDLDHNRAILCGPGLGTDAATYVPRIISQTSVPIVLDADALVPALLPALGSANAILTPHPGEFARLFPDLAAALADESAQTSGPPDLSGAARPAPLSRMAAATKAAARTGAIIVLKGHRTVVAAPDGRVAVNPDSTPALARAGTGDVLAGLIAGILAQGINAFEASCSAVWWHAQTARLLASERSVLGVDSQTLAQSLPRALVHLMGQNGM